MPNANRDIVKFAQSSRAPAWFRYGVVATATLLLCSCQSVGPHGNNVLSQQIPSTASEPTAFQAAAARHVVEPVVYQSDRNVAPPVYRQAQYAAGIVPPACAHSGCGSCGCQACGLVGPRDEYLCDGGDHGLPAGVKQDLHIDGLEQEDTVAHYDTVDGHTYITPSNQVCVYAPRFAVVRRVVDLQEYARYDAANGFGHTMSLAKFDENEKVATSLNKLEPHIDRVEDPASLLRERQQPGELGREVRLAADIGTLSPYADLQLVHTGTLVGDEKVKIARASIAAITWTGDEAPQIMIDSRNAIAAISQRQPGVVYHLDEPNKPCLRLVKLASTSTAKPGEEIEFTLRLDNMGNREMERVTVVDNLTTRLEYVADSAQSSVAADFSTDPQPTGSGILRWELKEPLQAGAGCILKFKCKVR